MSLAPAVSTLEPDRLRHMLIEIMSAQGLSHELAGRAKEIDNLLVANQSKIPPYSTKPSSPIARFVLIRAVQGPIYAGLREDSPFLHSPEFENELVRLMRGYVAQIGKDGS